MYIRNRIVFYKKHWIVLQYILSDTLYMIDFPVFFIYKFHHMHKQNDINFCCDF